MSQVQQQAGDSRARIGGGLALLTILCVGLYFGGVYRNHTYDYGFMVWNLFLAWIPLLLVIWLIDLLRRKRWSSWQGITLSVLWLGFLPNSFYIVSDLIHLEDTPRVDTLYDAVMLTSFVAAGLVLGYLSLYLFHTELRRRLPRGTTNKLVGFILLLCSFAIYLGRDLRWNTWDLFLNPAGILFDVSDRLINPRAHPQMLVTIASFFVLLAVLYLVILSFRPVMVAAPAEAAVQSSGPLAGKARRRT